MAIRTIQGLRSYLYKYSNFKEKTVNSVIKALGFPLNGSRNVYAWYALEEVSRTWLRYLEDNPALRAVLAA